MNTPTLQAHINAAMAYESLFVPALFRQWAAKLANAARIEPGQRVLDVACGTGILAREVIPRVLPSGHVAGIDPNPGMVAVARQLAPTVDWREGVAESLPFADQSFDAVVSQFGLMFFADRQQALREMLRVLVPGGHLVVAVWDSLGSMPAYASEVALLEKIAGREAADALRAPFVLGDLGVLSGLFAEVGIVSAEITTHGGAAHFPGIRTMVEADLRGWLPVMGVLLDEDRIGDILQQAEHVLSAYATADGQAVFPLSAHLVTARKT